MGGVGARLFDLDIEEDGGEVGWGHFVGFVEVGDGTVEGGGFSGVDDELFVAEFEAECAFEDVDEGFTGWLGAASTGAEDFEEAGAEFALGEVAIEAGEELLGELEFALAEAFGGEGELGGAGDGGGLIFGFDLGAVPGHSVGAGFGVVLADFVVGELGGEDVEDAVDLADAFSAGVANGEAGFEAEDGVFVHAGGFGDAADGEAGASAEVGHVATVGDEGF